MTNPSEAMPDQSEAPIVRAHLDDILQAWEGGTMDAAGTIEDLVERIDEATEIIRLCEEALEEASAILCGERGGGDDSQTVMDAFDALKPALAIIRGESR